MSSNNTDKAAAEKADTAAVSNFLQGGTLDELWDQFDSNNDGMIDSKEFNNLIYVSLKHFCLERNPDQPAPSKEAMRPFIKKLTEQLQPFVDKDQDKTISKEEFSGYGTYLTKEFNKLQEELKKE